MAYRGKGNEVLVVECKSYLDSSGVERSVFDGANKKAEKRYKLFRESTLRGVVLRRLERQLVSGGFCPPKPKIRLSLAAGKIRKDEEWLKSHFERKGWVLFGPEYIRTELKRLRDSGYENNVAAVVAKMLLREGKPVRVAVGIDADV